MFVLENWQSIAETIAVILSITYVILAAKPSIWCWPLAFISSILFVVVFFQSKLYLESILNGFYALMAIYGYYSWQKLNSTTSNFVQKKSFRFHIILISIGILFSILTGWLFNNYTDAQLPYLDATTTIFAIFATIMVTKKLLSNWIYFISIDLASIYMYWQKELFATVFLYLVYIIIAILGYINWLKLYKEQKSI